MQADSGAGRALVIGVPGATLHGVYHDIGAMSEMLHERGFILDIRTDERATRKGILAGYDELIARIACDAPAVIYYAGHGFHAIAPNEKLRTWQGICPTDFYDTTTDDFRGITSWELSVKLAQLTKRTKNVTVIFDCCNAAQMSREAAGQGGVPRAFPYPLTAGFEPHLRALRECYGADFDAVGPLGNPHAVRLVACKQDGGAFEYLGEDGKHHGALTGALLEVLEETHGAPVSWAAIDHAIRERVQRRFAAQRPSIEGPARRLLFSVVEQANIGGATSIIDFGDVLQLESGRLMGVSVGDIYAAMPSGAQVHRAADEIAELKVLQVSATWCDATVAGWKNGHTELPPHAVAMPVVTQAKRRPVVVDVPAEALPAVKTRLDDGRTLRIADVKDAPVLATLRLRDGLLTVEDPAGPLFPATPYPDGLEDAIANLANLGMAQAVRELEGEHGVSEEELAIEWGTVEQQQRKPMPEHASALALRDRLYVQITSKASRLLHVHVLNIGVRGKVSLLTTFAPTGFPLNGGDKLLLGQNPDGFLGGLALSWPARMPRDVPRVDELVVIVTSAPASLIGLETVEPPSATRGSRSKLEALLRQTRDGLPRNTRGEQAIDGYYMKRLTYCLHPRDAQMSDRSFEIDHNPLRQAGAQVPQAWVAPRGGAPASTKKCLAVELGNVVLANGASPPSALRFDALLCTRSQTAPGYACWTQRPDLAGTPAQLANPTVFRGTVCDFADLYLWISDAIDCPELEQLMSQCSATSMFRDAADSLVIGNGLSTTPWVASTGGSAVLARIAGDALCRVSASARGFYRTSFVLRDGLGQGGQPEKVTLRTASFSCELTVKKIDLTDARTC
jgi:hypothetical protein